MHPKLRMSCAVLLRSHHTFSSPLAVWRALARYLASADSHRVGRHLRRRLQGLLLRPSIRSQMQRIAHGELPSQCPMTMMLGHCGSCHVMSCHVVSSHLISSHLISSHLMAWHFMLCHVIPCHSMSCHVMSCHVMSCRVMSCHVMSCYTVPARGVQTRSAG
jgi:hypothetical protein